MKQTGRRLVADMEALRKKGIDAEAFYLFGAYDALLVSCASRWVDLPPLSSKGHDPNSAGIIEVFSHHGVVVDVWPESGVELSGGIGSSDIVGTISVKLSSTALRVLLAGSGRGRDFPLLQEFSREVRTKSGLSVTDRLTVLLSFETEDLIFVVQTGSFERIKKLSLCIQEHRNTLLTTPVVDLTTTTYGARMSKDGEPTLEHTEVESIQWKTLVAVESGAMRTVASSEGFSEDAATFVGPYPLAGRNDLVISSPGKKVPVRSFVDSHDLILGELRKHKNSVVSTETYLSFPNIDVRNQPKSDQDRRARPLLSAEPQFTKLVQQLENDKFDLTSFERDTFLQLLLRIARLCDDSFQTDSYKSFIPFVRRAIESYIGFDFEARRDGGFARIDSFAALLEYAFASRYQGRSAAGETAMRPMLGNHSSGKKASVALDYVGNLLVGCVTRKLRMARDPDRDIGQFVLISSGLSLTGGSRVPCAPLPVSFVIIPPRPVADLKLAILVFLHELGHVIFDCFMSTEGARPIVESRAFLGIRHMLSEVVSEYFAATLLCGSEISSYAERCKQILADSPLGRDSILRDRAEDIAIAVELQRSLSVGRTELIRYLSASSNFKKLFGAPAPDRLPQVLAKILSDISETMGSEVADGDVREVRRLLREIIFSGDPCEESRIFWHLWSLMSNPKMQAKAYERSAS